MKRLFALVAIAASTLLSGCGTLVMRTNIHSYLNKDDKSDYYPACNFDIRLISEFATAKIDEQWYLDLLIGRPVGITFLTADLIPSFVSDTICLPHDVQQQMEKIPWTH